MLISIITPTYNSSSFIRRAYQSLCRQTDLQFEWVLVDDGSTDNTLDILSGYKSPFHGGIHVFKLPQNSGGNAAKTAAILKSRGAIVIFLDHDDELLPNAIQRVRSEFQLLHGKDCIAGLLFPSVTCDSGARISSMKQSQLFKYSQFLNSERESLDGLMAFRGSLIRRAFSNPSRAMTILGGVTMLEISKNYVFKFISGSPLLIYHKDNPDSASTNVIISNKLVYSYSRILDLHDSYF